MTMEESMGGPAPEAPAPAPPRKPENETPHGSVIGRDLIVKGDITSKGDLRIDGTVEGNVHCVGLHVGATGSVTGDVAADNVTVEGRVQGSVQSGSVSLRAESVVEGDILSQGLAIDHGAYFDGRARPTGAAAKDEPRLAAE